jgi:diguanylate cyclase (GGDEF)-like protein/PAS domain S-box-containing protein
VAHLKQKLVTGEVGSVSIEKRYIHKNGAILWANLTLSLLRDADGSPLCDIAVIQDISDRRAALRDRQQAEANLQIKQIQLEALLNNIPHIAWLKDRESRFIAVNEAFGLAVGWSPEALVGQTDSEIASDLTAQQYRHEDLTVMRQGHRRIVEEEMVTVAGERRWMETIRTPIRDEGGEITGTVGIAVDITDRKQTEVRLREREAAVRQREATTRAILQAIPDLLLHHDSNGICVDVIPGETVKLIGEPNHLVGCSAYDYLPPDLANQRMHYVRLAQATGEVQLYEQELERGGEVHYEEVRLVPGHNQDVLAIVRDISDRKRAEAELERYRLQLEDMVAARTAALEREIAERKRIEQQLFQEKELAQVTLHSIGDAVIATDALGCVEYLNPVAERLTGWDAAAARGRSLATIFEVIDEATREPIDNPVAPILRHDRPQAIDSQSVLVARNGIPYSIDSSAAPIHNREGDTIGAVLVFRDVTRSRMLARQLSWQASHDALTRLTNRRHFEQVLSEVVQGTKLDRQQHTFCFLDLDRFKVVNDTCGHLAGDELLRQVSALLKTRVRATDTLARLGGDEFGILLQQCPLTQAETIAEWMRKAIHGFRFVWENRAFTIGVSIGLVPLNGDSHSLASILSAADAACYAAKERGRNRIHVYQPDDLELARQRSERQWSVRIRQALEDNRFCLYRQAIVPTLTHPSLGDSEMRDSSTGDSPWPVEDRGQQYELLLRMVDSNGHIIQPSAFIPAAERYDLMPEIDRWVVRTFLNFCQLYPEQIPCSDPDTPSLLYTINLSGASISDDRWLQWLKEELQQYPAFARATCFEITETAAITSLNRATRSVWDLKQLGCRFALDDFGTGMSSFAYLKHLPVDYLKIDGRFIEDMESDLTARAIVESINHIGHVMGLKTIAEYVGNAAIRQLLGDMGVDYVQGYGIAVPSPIVWPQSPYRLSS